MEDLLKKVERKRARRRILSSIMKMLLAGGLFTLLIVFVAVSNGIGYEGSVNLKSTSLLVEGHPCAGVECVLDLNMSYNPFLYPVSYASAKGQISGTFNVIYYPPATSPHIPSSAELEESITGNLAWSEMLKNLPYLFIVGFIIGFVVTKTIQTAKSRVMERRKATSSQVKI